MITEQELAEFLLADRWNGTKGHAWVFYGIARAYGSHLKRPIVALEIGVCEGSSTIPLLAGLVAGHPDSVLVSVDNDSDVQGRVAVAVERVKHFNLEKNWKFFCTDSHTFDPVIAPYDLVFIDGDHEIEGVKKDFNLAAANLRQHGLILMHDAEPGGAGDVWTFIQNHLPSGWQMVTIPIYHGLAILRRWSDWDNHGFVPSETYAGGWH